MNYDFMGIHDFWIYVGMGVFAIIAILVNMHQAKHSPKEYREAQEKMLEEMFKDEWDVNPGTGLPLPPGTFVDAEGYLYGESRHDESQ